MNMMKIWEYIEQRIGQYKVRKWRDDGALRMHLELREAHLDWICAQKRLQAVSSFEEIDYSIYLLETSEKRYNMFLKQAKNMYFKSKMENNK
jgi:hypothetical protein